MMKKMNSSKITKGFTLIEMIIAMGISAIVIAGFMNYMKVQLSSAKYIESIGTIDGAVNNLRFYFLDKEACFNTFGGVALPAIGTVAVPITEIKNKNGGVVHGIPATFGSDELVKLEKVELYNSGGISSNAYGIVFIKLYFSRNSQISSGGKNVIKELEVVVETDAVSKIGRCFSNTENAIETAYNKVCEDIGGKLDPVTNKCAFFSLVNGQHTEKQCQSSGGSIVQLNEGTVCKFVNGTSVPNGWSRYKKWSTSSSVIAKDTDCTTSNTTVTAGNIAAVYSNPNQYAAYPASVSSGCTTGNHAWSNTVLETCSFTCVEDAPCASSPCRTRTYTLTSLAAEEAYY